MAARHIEILKRRCRPMLTWWWECERTGTSFLDVLLLYMVVAMWEGGLKVTSLSQGASVYIVVAM